MAGDPVATPPAAFVMPGDPNHFGRRMVPVMVTVGYDDNGLRVCGGGDEPNG